MRTHGTEGIFVLILGLLLSFFPGCASEPLEEGATSGEVALHSEPLVADAVGGRPASVPGDFITTPFGWAHPSCVIHVAEDEEQRDKEIFCLASTECLSAMGGCDSSQVEGGSAKRRRRRTAGSLSLTRPFLKPTSFKLRFSMFRLRPRVKTRKCCSSFQGSNPVMDRSSYNLY